MATNQQLINVIYLTLIAGLAMPLGAILAQIEQHESAVGARPAGGAASGWRVREQTANAG